MAWCVSSHINQTPSDWGNSAQTLFSHWFMVIIEACANRLSAARGRHFLRREWLDLSR